MVTISPGRNAITFAVLLAVLGVGARGFGYKLQQDGDRYNRLLAAADAGLSRQPPGTDPRGTAAEAGVWGESARGQG